jgi:hypothetical protein
MRTVTTKRLELARKAALKRFRRNIDQSVIYKATDTVFVTPERLMGDHVNREQERLARLPLKNGKRAELTKLGIAETAAEAPTWTDMVERYARFWNSQADEIEARYGPFPLRFEAPACHFAPRVPRSESGRQLWAHAVEVLLFYSVMKRNEAEDLRDEFPLVEHFPGRFSAAEALIEERIRQAEIYDSMADVLLMSIVPASFIERQSSGRGSIWERLRKTKLGVTLKREAFLRDTLAALRENQQREAILDGYRKERARFDEMMRQIRLDPEAKDVAVLPLVLGELKTNFPAEIVKKVESGDK